MRYQPHTKYYKQLKNLGSSRNSLLLYTLVILKVTVIIDQSLFLPEVQGGLDV